MYSYTRRWVVIYHVRGRGRSCGLDLFTAKKKQSGLNFRIEWEIKEK
jgi:hypothetical protein